ncbi:MAG: YetF domain-containing protein [Bacteriovorax sp.]|jgi:uncharacterized membrane protein YcaP (DUF421 family)
MTSPWYEPIIRGTVVYLFIFLVVRILGKKKLGELALFDLVLLIIMSAAVRNAIIGLDQSITAGLICVSVLGVLNTLINNLSFHFRWFEKILEGQPEVIILNGKIHKKVLKREKISDAELFEALREHEIMNPEDVKCAILETDGKISVIRYVH